MFGRQPAKQTRLQGAPNENVLMQLMQAAQKQVDKTASASWPGKNGDNYVLVISKSVARERRGWNSRVSAGTNDKVFEPEWVLYKEAERGRTELWRIDTPDVAVVLNLLDQSLYQGPSTNQTETLKFTADQVAAAYKRPQQDDSIPPRRREPTMTRMETQSEAAPPVQAPPVERAAAAGVNLSGNLKEVDLPSILQSVSLCKMTGRLNVYDALNQVEIFFADGELIHALSCHALDSSKALFGEAVILDVFTWDEGTFQFQHGWKTSERSVQKRLQSMLLEGATLRDHKDWLDKHHISNATILTRAVPNMTEAEFEKRLAQGLPLHVDLQKRVFLELDEAHSAADILDLIPMSNQTWITVLFSLLNCKLVAVHELSTDSQKSFADFSNINDLMWAAEKSLVQPDTDMVSYQMFLVLLEREFARYAQTSLPFSIAMFEFNCPGAVITNDTLKKVAATFDAVRLPYECVAFWHPNRLFMLLPHIEPVPACERIAAFYGLLEQESLDGISAVNLACGLANVPSDGTKILDLLGSAARLTRKALDDGTRLATTLVIKPEQKWPEDNWDQLCHLAGEAMDKERYTEAEQLWSLAYSRSRNFQDSDLKQAFAAQALARIYGINKDYEKAESMLRMALDLQINTLGHLHLENVQIVDDLAKCLYVQSKYKDAEAIASHSVEICESAFGPQDPQLATALYNLAQIYHVQNNLVQAEPLYRRCFEIRKSTLGPNHPFTKKTERNYRLLVESKVQAAGGIAKTSTGTGASTGATMSGTWQTINMEEQAN